MLPQGLTIAKPVANVSVVTGTPACGVALVATKGAFGSCPTPPE